MSHGIFKFVQINMNTYFSIVSLFLKNSFFQDCLEMATAVVLSRGVGKNFSPYIDRVLIFLHILVLQEHLALTESRIPLKPVLRDVRIVAFLLVFMNRLNKTKFTVFL